MSQPLISILHPTARVKPSEAFPRGWESAFQSFVRNLSTYPSTDARKVEYIVVVHQSRWEQFWENGLFLTAETLPQLCDDVTAGVNVDGGGVFPIRVVKNSLRDCVVDQINVAAAASTGKILFGVMDDLEPPEHWDTLLLEALEVDKDGMFVDGSIDGEYVLHFSTGSPSDKDLMVCGAITRKRYERYGYALDPDFESMFADNYFTWQARQDEAAGLCRIITRLDIEFKHNHPMFERGKMDDIYALQNREQAYAQGQATFLKKTNGTRAIFVCLPGETFRHEWVANAFALLNHINHGMRFLLTPVWGFSTNVHCTRIELAEAVLEKGIKADLVLWLDDDNILTPAQFELLLQDLEERPELAGVVGWCWCDNDGQPDLDGNPKPWMISCGRQGPEFQCKKITQEDLLQSVESGRMLITSDDISPDAFWSGFPVVLMRGSTLETVGARAFVPIVRDDVKYGFVSEDAAFFYRAHQAGLKFAVDLRVQVPHLKFRAIAPQFIAESDKPAALKSRGQLEEAFAMP